MKRKKLPEYLLTVSVLAFVFFFGIMTALTGGGRIARSAADAANRRSVTNALQAVQTGIKAVTAEYNLVSYKKQWLVSVSGAVRRVLGDSFFPNADGNLVQVRLNDGLIAKLKTNLDVRESQGALIDIRDFLDERDIDLIITYAHTKVIYPETQLPAGAEDNSNAIADRFFRMLDDLGIEYIDTRPILRASGIPSNELYYHTDGHWTIPAAFEAFQVLAERLNATGRFAIPHSVIDRNSYFTTVLDQHFLGSDGRALGAEHSQLDDFVMIMPTFETRFQERSVNTDGEWEERIGSFEQAILNMDRLTPDEGEIYSTGCYATYGYNRPEVLITNELMDTGRVLFIKNSAGNPLLDFIALGVREACGVDRRVLTTSTIADYIDAYRPDAVVIAYNYDFIKPDRLDIFTISTDPGLE